MPVTVRFAPSPTGRLHAGNIRTALLNYLFARKHGGRFILRLDDTDQVRSTRGIRTRDRGRPRLARDFVGKARRISQTASHSTPRRSKTLEAEGRLYPAYETREELDLKRKRQLARGKPPVYDRAALQLSDEDKAKLEAEGRKPHWRFKLEPRDVVWDDLVRGRQHVDAASLSDPVLVRGDGTYLYTLPSVVDDIDLGVTHVIRGEDHVANTAPQIQLFEALGATPPAFGHHNLLVGRRRSGVVEAGPLARHRGHAGRGLRGVERGKLRRHDRHVGPGGTARQPRGLGGRVRLRQAVTRAGAIRSP